MYIVVGSNIIISDPTKEIKAWCRNNLTISNPDYYKLARLGKWTGNTPRELCLYEVIGNEIIIPFGCLKALWNIAKDSKWCPSAHFGRERDFDYGSNIQPFSYQEEAIQKAIMAKNGILVMPCGSGKTQSGLEIISRLKGRALWLTHTQDLLNQSKKRAESVLDNVGCGIITDGKVSVGNGITFATVQTMSKVNLTHLYDYWDIVIVDECQHCSGTPTRVTQFYKVVNQLCARYKIGLTATPYRSDGLDKAMFSILGDIIHEVPREAVADTTCPIEVMQVETGWFPDDDIFRSDGTMDYTKIIDSMVNDVRRFNLISKYINSLDGSCIVLANRVKYLQELCFCYGGKGVCLSGMGQSSKAKAERKEALRKLNDGEIDCIFATYQLAKEGLDVPNLRYVVLATPEKDETTVIQSVGRVGRKADGKDKGRVIDFVDDMGMHRNWARKRVKYYKKIDAEIILKGV